MHLSVCFPALLTMSVFCSKCPAKVGPETAVSGSLGRQDGSGTAVSRAIGRQVGPRTAVLSASAAVLGALERQAGSEMAALARNSFIRFPQLRSLWPEFCIDI